MGGCYGDWGGGEKEQRRGDRVGRDPKVCERVWVEEVGKGRSVEGCIGERNKITGGVLL